MKVTATTPHPRLINSSYVPLSTSMRAPLITSQSFNFSGLTNNTDGKVVATMTPTESLRKIAFLLSGSPLAQNAQILKVQVTDVDIVDAIYVPAQNNVSTIFYCGNLGPQTKSDMVRLAEWSGKQFGFVCCFPFGVQSSEQQYRFMSAISNHLISNQIVPLSQQIVWGYATGVPAAAQFARRRELPLVMENAKNSPPALPHIARTLALDKVNTELLKKFFESGHFIPEEELEITKYIWARRLQHKNFNNLHILQKAQATHREVQQKIVYKRGNIGDDIIKSNNQSLILGTQVFYAFSTSLYGSLEKKLKKREHEFSALEAALSTCWPESTLSRLRLFILDTDADRIYSWIHKLTNAATADFIQASNCDGIAALGFHLYIPKMSAGEVIRIASVPGHAWFEVLASFLAGRDDVVCDPWLGELDDGTKAGHPVFREDSRFAVNPNVDLCLTKNEAEVSYQIFQELSQALRKSRAVAAQFKQLHKVKNEQFKNARWYEHCSYKSAPIILSDEFLAQVMKDLQLSEQGTVGRKTSNT